MPTLADLTAESDLLTPLAPDERGLLAKHFEAVHYDIGEVVQLALQALANLGQQRASALGYFDVFWALAVVMVELVFVVLLMKRSVAEKGARIGAE